jgi:hypothetical protein
LAAATDYGEFALSCGDDLVASHFAHKVAWGAAALAAAGQTRWSKLATDITDHLVGGQDVGGAWLAGEAAHTKYDQTAEVAIWLYEISAELERAGVLGRA